MKRRIRIDKDYITTVFSVYNPIEYYIGLDEPDLIHWLKRLVAEKNKFKTWEEALHLANEQRIAEMYEGVLQLITLVHRVKIDGNAPTLGWYDSRKALMRSEALKQKIKQP